MITRTLEDKPTLRVPGRQDSSVATSPRLMLLGLACLLTCLLVPPGCVDEQVGDASGIDVAQTDVEMTADTDSPAARDDQPVRDSQPLPDDQSETAASEPAVAETPPPRPPRPVKSTAETLAELLPVHQRPENRQVDQPPLPAQAQKAVDEAREYIEQGSFDLARLRLERALGFAPDNLVIHRLLGIVFLERNNTGKAREHFDAVLRVAPDDLEIQVLRGRVFDREQNRARAIRAYRTALLCSDASPENPLAGFALYRLADLLEANRQLESALGAFEALTQWVGEHADAYARNPTTAELALKPEMLLVRRGTLLLRLRYADEAIELLARAHDRDSSDARATGLLLEASSVAGRHDLARDVLAGYTGHEIGPAAVQTTINGLIRRFIADGEPQEGLLWLAELVAKHPEWASVAEIAVRDILAETVSQRFAQQFIEAIPAEPSESRHVLRYFAGLLANRLDMLHQASEQFRLAVEADPTFVPAYEALIYAYIAQGRYDMATRAADRLTASEENRWMVTYLRGKAMVAMGEFEKAIDVLLEARSLRDDYQPIHLLLADAYRSMGMFAQAADAMEQAVRLDPTTPGLFRKWLALHCRNGTLTDFATNVVPYWARQQGGNLQFQLMRAEQELWTGDTAAASELIDDLQEQHPDNIDVQLLGVYGRLWMARPGRAGVVRPEPVGVGADRDAPWLMQRAVAADSALIGSPFHTDLEVWVDVVPQRALKAELARLNEIRARWPDDRQARVMTAQVLSSLGENTQAIDLWQSLQIIDSRNLTVIRGYTRDLIAAGKHARAVVVLTDALGAYPHDYSLRRSLIAALMRMERFEDAIAFLREWLDAPQAGPDDHWQHRVMLVKALTGARMFDDCHALLDEMITDARGRSIDIGPFEREKFRLYVLAGEYADGIDLVKARLATWMAQPGVVLPHRAQAEGPGADYRFIARTLAGDYEDAMEWARNDIDAWRDPQAPENSIIGVLLQAARHDDVLDLLQTMIDLYPEARIRDMLRWKMLVVYAMTDRYDKGYALLDTWIYDKLEVSRNQFASWKVIYYLLDGRHDDAAAFVEQWLQRDPMSHAPRQAAIFLLTDAQQHERLLALLDEWDAELAVLAPLPDGPAKDRRASLVEQLRLARFAALFHLGRYEETIERMEEALKTDPDNILLLMRYAIVLGEVGRDDDRIAALEQALRLQPSNVFLLNNLAYALADRGIRLSQAETLIQRAVSGNTNPTFLDTQAWVFYKQGRNTDAAVLFGHILDMVEADREHDIAIIVWDHAGDAYYRSGRPEEAVELWRRAAELAENEETQTADVRNVLANTPAKIAAVANGDTPAVAPLGEGVEDPLFPVENETQPAEEDAALDAEPVADEPAETDDAVTSVDPPEMQPAE